MIILKNKKMKTSQSLRSKWIPIAFLLILAPLGAFRSATAQVSMPLSGSYVNSNGQTILPVAGQSGLLFVSTDEALAFYETSSGQIEKLTEPFTGKEFSVSPDGRTILFGNQIVSLQSQSSGNVSVSVSIAAYPRDQYKLNWSPDGNEFGYVKQDGSTGIEDLPGNLQQLYKSDSPPDWSFDGRWMAYCDRRGRLWIARTGKPADWIARQGSCNVDWSPKKPILAYVMYPAEREENPVDGIAYLYNPITGRTKEIARTVSRLE